MYITGKEKRVYTNQEIADGSQNYANLFSQDASYTNFEIFGSEYIQSLLDTDLVKGIKAVNITDNTGQTCLSLVPVDSNGNELEVPVTASKDAPQSEPPVRCPNSCS